MVGRLEFTGISVLPEWIDYNGHMNVAYYVLAFDKATDALFERIGVSETYRRATDHSTYALEAHVTFDREVREGDPLRFETQLIDADEKRLFYYHEMFHARAGYLAATLSQVTLHVDLSGPRAAPFQPEQQATIAAILEDHGALPRPARLDNRIGLRRK